MKKIITFAAVIALTFCSLFAENKFKDRFIELYADASANASNNGLSMSEIFVKDVVIDLTKLADSLPDSGYKASMTATPLLGLKLNLSAFTIDFSIGATVDEYLQIGKSYFDILGHGYDYTQYTKENPLSFDINSTTDAFVYGKFDIGFNVKKFKIVAKPTLFVPMFHATPEKGTMTFTNLEDGTISAEVSQTIAIYSVAEATYNNGTLDFFDSMNVSDFGYGFDMGATVSYELNDKLNFTVNTRVPIIPGQLKHATKLTFDAAYNANAEDFVKGQFYDSEKTSASITTSDGKNYDLMNSEEDYSDMNLSWINADYKIHRPFKFEGYATFNLNSSLAFTGGAGLGVVHPFSSDASEISVYPEYFAGANLSLGGVVNAHVSTEYMDRIFKHEVGLGFNIRILELNAGISLQSTDFKTSFTMSGLGSYVTLAIGF